MNNITIKKGNKVLSGGSIRAGGSVPSGGSVGSGGSVPAGGSVASGGSVGSGGGLQEGRGPANANIAETLQAIQQHIQGRFHHKSKLPFGGALLAPFVSNTMHERTLKPALRKLQQAGPTAKDHPVATEMLNLQERYASKDRSLRNKILDRHSNLGDEPQQEKLENPYEHMNDSQLFHHTINMPNKDWKEVRDVAGTLLGKVPGRFSTPMTREQLSNHVRKFVPQLQDMVDTSQHHDIVNHHQPLPKHLEKHSHIADISLSDDPVTAAERLERDPTGSFGNTLKSVMWLNHVNGLHQ